MKTKDTAIAWVMALLSVCVAWQSDLTRSLDLLADSLGAAQSGILRRSIVDGGAPLALTTLAALSQAIYFRWLWRMLAGSRYCGGWWIYALKASTGALVAGVFRVTHLPTNMRIDEGHAFYIEDSGLLEYRGDWNSDTMSACDERIRFVFSMNAVSPREEAIPSNYDGFLELVRQSEDALAGLSSWRGYFNDLKDRSRVFGPVYAENLGHRIKKAEARMRVELHAQELATRLHA